MIKHISTQPFRKISSLLVAMIFSQLVFAQMNPLPLGNIQAGDSVVIYYDATVDNPLPGGITQISSQGTLSGGNFTSFLTNDPGTAGPNIPTIIMLNVVLPVNLIDFMAAANGSGIELNWKASAETDLHQYVIERSADGRTFKNIGSVAARNTSGIQLYSFTDKQPLEGVNYYRLRMEDIDGGAKYSQILRIGLKGGEKAIAIYPNPVIGSMLALQFSHVPRNTYQMDIFNNSGSLVFSKQIRHGGGTSTQTVQLASLIPGVYHIHIRANGLRFTKTVIVK